MAHSSYYYLKRFRATEKGRQHRKADKERYYSRVQGDNSARFQRYTEREIQMILDRKLSDSEIAELLGRTILAIQVKRSNLKAKTATKNDFEDEENEEMKSNAETSDRNQKKLAPDDRS